MIPSCDQTGVPGLVAFAHFHSSRTSGSASLIRERIRESISPRQSPSSSILASICSAGVRECMSVGGGEPPRRGLWWATGHRALGKLDPGPDVHVDDDGDDL